MGYSNRSNIVFKSLCTRCYCRSYSDSWDNKENKNKNLYRINKRVSITFESNTLAFLIRQCDQKVKRIRAKVKQG